MWDGLDRGGHCSLLAKAQRLSTGRSGLIQPSAAPCTSRQSQGYHPIKGWPEAVDGENHCRALEDQLQPGGQN